MSSSRKPRLSNSPERLALPGTVWIASDIHLGPDVPATARAFHRFLQQACVQADALLLCGDIFDAWIGDDFAGKDAPQWLRESLAALRDVSARIPLWLGRGNRDFLLGETLARQVGARLLPDSVVIETAAGRVLLSHGDEYCTQDRAYQRFRRLVRRRSVQRLFLSLSLSVRRRIADFARRRSMAGNQYKSAAIMDVAPVAVARAFERSGVCLMVHGHTHRPAVHTLEISGRECKRIVLPDWEFDGASPRRGGWVVLDAQGARLKWAEALSGLSARS